MLRFITDDQTPNHNEFILIKQITYALTITIILSVRVLHNRGSTATSRGAPRGCVKRNHRVAANFRRRYRQRSMWGLSDMQDGHGCTRDALAVLPRVPPRLHHPMAEMVRVCLRPRGQGAMCIHFSSETFYPNSNVFIKTFETLILTCQKM